GIPLDRDVLLGDRLAVAANPSLGLEPPGFGSAGHEPHGLEKRWDVDDPDAVLLLTEDDRRHPDLRDLLGDLVLAVHGVEAVLGGGARLRSVVQVDHLACETPFRL